LKKRAAAAAPVIPAPIPLSSLATTAQAATPEAVDLVQPGMSPVPMFSQAPIAMGQPQPMPLVPMQMQYMQMQMSQPNLINYAYAMGQPMQMQPLQPQYGQPAPAYPYQPALAYGQPAPYGLPLQPEYAQAGVDGQPLSVTPSFVNQPVAPGSWQCPCCYAANLDADTVCTVCLSKRGV